MISSNKKFFLERVRKSHFFVLIMLNLLKNSFVWLKSTKNNLLMVFWLFLANGDPIDLQKILKCTTELISPRRFIWVPIWLNLEWKIFRSTWYAELKGRYTQFYILISLISYWLNKFELLLSSDSIAEQNRFKKISWRFWYNI